MSYEFNPESQMFEFPNPYKVENLFLMLCGAVMLLAGGGTMFSVRDRIAHSPDGRALAVVGLSIILLMGGILLLARAFTQLRYFFGRNRPDSLAPNVAPDRDGNSPLANHFKETLRQNAIAFNEPKGPLNGLLYSWLPHLIFAPEVIQRTAQAQFYNFLALAATLFSFLTCWLLFGHGAASGWIGLVYAAFAAPLVVRPMVQQTAPTTGAVAATGEVGSRSLIVLVALALLGPAVLAVLGSHLPSLGDLSINGALALALVCALIGCGAFGLALKHQLQPAPQAVGSARVTETVTMNAHPNKLVEELDRLLMNRWYSRIPNRRYTRQSPVVDGQQGRFVAEIFEESQPRPQASRTATGVAHAMSVPQFRWITILTGIATFYMVIGTIGMLTAARAILAPEPVASTLAFALTQLAVGLYCFRAAHVLWGRFDFVSELIWVDIAGSYESARVNIGNQISGAVQTSKNVVNIENMTMRVWVSEIDTVIFGKDAPRQLIGMRGLQETAEELAASLKKFGEAQTMVVAPTSAQDLDRAAKVGLMQQLAAGSSPADVQHLAASLQAGDNAALASPPASATPACSACGTPYEAGAKFCGECGKPLAA